MKELKEVILSKENEPTYITYFYHKLSSVVYKVVSNGSECAVSLGDKIGVSRSFNFRSTLPKYIEKQIKHQTTQTINY